ncbi:MAG: arylsulfatase [Gammaproteobacteria bacterium]|nr:arylsulfatase [Gammaproteobacteria bacterium]
MTACTGGPGGDGANAPAPSPAAGATPAPRRPNILVVVADDLGYNDLGYNGGEIATPTLDALAREGVIFTDFYAAPTCSPTRAMLLSGTDSHVAGLGNMAEAIALMPEQQGKPGYEGYLNERVATLPELLRDGGYHTYMAGKWHLGLEEDQSPAARGFDRSYALLQAGGGHFDDLALFGGKSRYRENGKEVELPADFYSTRFFSDRIIGDIESHRADGRPWFAYLAYSAPHWPLQAPAESIATYAGRYDAGYDALVAARLARLKQLGLVAEDVVASPREPDQPAWDALTPEQKLREARKMEIFAAMVDDLDSHFGRVVEYLRSSGQYDDTFIFFMSDNGPEGHDGHDFPPLRQWMQSCCDLSDANMGRPNSYVMYGPNWARAGDTPARMFKHYTLEGGIHVPAFAHYPKGFRGGRRTAAFATVKDVLPTLLALAGIGHPGTHYRGRDIAPLQGSSMLPVLHGEADTVHAPDEVMGWELFGRKALRQGRWKLVWTEPPYGRGEWELHDLQTDPAELRDLGAGEPERVAALRDAWQDYARENGVLPGMTLDAAMARMQNAPPASPPAARR